MPNSHHHYGDGRYYCHGRYDRHGHYDSCHPNGRGPNVCVRDMAQRSMLLPSMILEIRLPVK